MTKHLYGKIWGILQLGFWIIMIPWIILAIPVDLYIESHSVSPQIAQFFAHAWLDWRTGVVVLSTLNVFLISIVFIWRGWQKMHPLATKGPENIEQHTLDRLNAVKGFSKDAYLDRIREEAIHYQQKRNTRKVKSRVSKNEKKS